MTLLPILYWVILILSILGIWLPPEKYGPRISAIAFVALFVIIGLHNFKVTLQ